MLICFYNFQGESYKLIWPQNQEFVRMAARFGATIVPFGVVGEDDIAEVSFPFTLNRCFTFCPVLFRTYRIEGKIHSLILENNLEL